MQQPRRSDLKNCFASGNARQSLMMSGCVVAAFGFGAAAPDLINLMHNGFSHMASFMPLADPVQIAGHYFQGALDWLGSVAVGSSEMVVKFGGSLAADAADAIQQIQSQMVGTTNNMRQAFDHALTKSGEVASLWRTIVRDSVAQPVIESARAVSDMIPDDPADAATAFGKLMVSAVECFGVVKGMHEAYGWTMRRFRKRLENAPAVSASSEQSGLSIGSVTNLSINLSLGGDAASQNAMQQVERLLSMGGDRRIQIDEAALRRLLDNAVPADAPAARKQAEVDAAREEALQTDDSADRGAAGSSRGAGIINSRDILQVSKSLSLALKCEVSEKLNKPMLSSDDSIMKPIASIDGGIITAMSMKRPYSVDRGRITRFLPEADVRKMDKENLDRPNGPMM